jgi:hypothetical protein
VSWTYLGDFNLPLDQVRFLIQDVQTNRQLATDEEINWVLSTEANIYMAAAAVCDVISSRYAGAKSRWIGDLRLVYDPAHYRGLAASLRARGAGHQTPFAGGISVSDKMIQQQDADAVQPRSFRTQLDNPAADQPSPGPDRNPLTSTP